MWTWVAFGLAGWLLVSVLVAVVLGRGIRLAEVRERDTAARPVAVRAGRQRRRSIPLPPVGIALAATAVALESIGYAQRLTGATSPTARLLSMDAPFSAPRLLVAAMFGVAAIAALVAATRIPGRRSWWLAVGLIAAAIALVKTGSTVHADAMSWMAERIGFAGATLVSVGAALVVVATLAFISRAERRDRRRVLGALAAYAVAAVGLSAVSGLVPGQLYATATFVEESGEALAGVAFLVAVLIGVAPRLVLPASWAIRRAADAHTLEVVQPTAGPIRH